MLNLDHLLPVAAKELTGVLLSPKPISNSDVTQVLMFMSAVAILRGCGTDAGYKLLRTFYRQVTAGIEGKLTPAEFKRRAAEMKKIVDSENEGVTFSGSFEWTRR